MQETLATPPLFDPPVETFQRLYTQWATAHYGLIITGQVQVDIRYLSVPGDVVSHAKSLEEPHISKWKQWAHIAKQNDTPAIVQLAHPGRMSPAGAGIRPLDQATLCPSSVPVKLGDSWLDEWAQDKILGTPKEMAHEEIDGVVDMFKHAARVSVAAGFDGVQIHGAHGFLVSEFLSPHTNRRTDEYGGDPWRRLKFLRRLVEELRAICPPPLCLSVKLNSADYMAVGGLQQDEGLEQVRWLVECGMVDLVEISGGNAENATSKLHNSFDKKSIDTAPKKKGSTRIREAFFTDFAEKVQGLQSKVPIQLSGGFRSRTGMADAIDSGICDMIGLGRAAVLQPTLPDLILLNSAIPDSSAVAMSHIVKGQWLAKWVPAKVVGASLGIQFFYHNMRRLGKGFSSDPDITIPRVLLKDGLENVRYNFMKIFTRIVQTMKPYVSW